MICILEKIKKCIVKNKSFIINGLVPMFVFLVLFLAYYPGIITYDGNNQWQQVQSGIITNSHPFFSTYFMLFLSKIHNTTSTILLFQMFTFSIIWGVFCQNIKCSKKQEVLKAFYTLLLCLTPIIGLYSISLWKDILYSYYLFLIAIMFFTGLKRKFNYKLIEYIAFGILLTLVSSYRHNGIIVVICIILMILIICLKNRNKLNFSLVKRMFLSFLVFILGLCIINIPKTIILNKSDKIIKEGQTSEQVKSKLALKEKYILWIMGAHIKNNNITNDKDVKFLSKILDFETWKKIYDPYLINNISFSADIDGKFVNENKDKLQSIFIKYTLENPLTVIGHYLRCDALLINPISQKYGYVYVFSFSEWTGGSLGFESITNSKIPIVKYIYNIIINCSFLPIIKYLYQPAVMLYLSIIILIILAKKAYGKYIYLFGTPMLFNTISLLPINLAQDLRYAYINFLTFFALLLLLILNCKNKLKTTKKTKKGI